MIESIQKQSDAGTYTCQARNSKKLSDRKDVEVYIMGAYLYLIIKSSFVVVSDCNIALSVPPKILPIQGIVLREGMRAAITCQIIDGDLPFTFRWERNGEPVTDGKLQIRRVDEYATLLVIDNISTVHTGNYTCLAENVAGVESFTVPLTVNGRYSSREVIYTCLVIKFLVKCFFGFSSSKVADRTHGFKCCSWARCRSGLSGHWTSSPLCSLEEIYRSA